MNSYGIRFLGHNIPRGLPENFSSIFGFRIQNTLNSTLYFHNHASFYGTVINDNAFKINIFLDGDFLINALVLNDCIHSGQSATLFFPFQTKGEGEYRLRIIMAEQNATMLMDHGDTLLDMVVRVKGNSSGFNLKRKIERGLFTFLYSEFPIQLKKLQFRFYKAKYYFFHHGNSSKRTILKQLKDINRQLAFMEKQVRKLKVASLPCYVGIDTTSRCNLNCKSCFRNYLDIDLNTKPDMPDNMVHQLIKDLFPTAYTVNLSTIGEPLLSRHMEKILNACIEYQVSLSLTTNGTLLEGDDFLEKLASVLHHIEISFDSSSPELFKNLRSGASYKDVLRNVKNLRKIRCSLPEPRFNLGFSMTLFRENMEEIPDILDVLSEAGGNFLKTDIGVVFDRRDLHRSVLNYPDLYNKTYEIAQEKAREIGISLLMRPPFSENGQSEAAKYGICDYLYLSACIRPEGELNPCYFQVIPSLKVKNGFRNAWSSEMMQRLRIEHDTNRGHPLCRDCYLILEGSDNVENRRKQFLKGDALKWGTVINFAKSGNAEHYKAGGWGSAEGTFTWTEGASASLNIPISVPEEPFVILKAGLSAFLNPGKVDRQTVRILINSKAVGIWVFEDPTFQEKMLFIPRVLLTKSNNMEISFYMPDAVSPAQVRFNNDKRVLGLAVQTIELTK